MGYLLLSGISAVIDWYSVAKDRKQLEYVFKPATLTFLILWYLTSNPFDHGLLGMAILGGLIFSLIGDIFLMLPNNRLVLGLVAFLCAHIAYIVGFNSSGIALDWTAIVLLVIGILALYIFRRLREGLLRSGQNALVLPVAVYVIVISVMVWSACTTLQRPEWAFNASLLCSFGAALFFASDTLLGWNRFVRPLRNGNLAVIFAYHVAQFLISLGVILHIQG